MAEAWKARLREHVVEADGHCGSVLEHLAAVHLHLSTPMHTGDAAGARTRIQLAQDKLKDASSGLTLAVSLMAAARELALHGGSLNPAQQLPSINHLGGHDLVPVRKALTSLTFATMKAEDAYEAVDRCCGYLCAASLLIDHSGLPGVEGFIDDKRLAAANDLELARDLAKGSAELAGVARRIVAGVN